MLVVLVLCLFFGLILTPIRFDVCYSGKIAIDLYFLGFRKKLKNKVKIGGESNNKKKSEKRKSTLRKQKRVKFRIREFGANVSFWGKRIRGYFRLLRRLLPFCFRLKNVSVRGGFFCDNMALTGVVFGLLGSMFALHGSKVWQIDLVPDFCEQKTEVELFISGYVWVMGLLICGFVFLFKFLSDFVLFKGGKWK